MLSHFSAKLKEFFQKKYLLQKILLTYSFSVILFAMILFVISAAFYMNSVKQNTQHNLNQTYDKVTRLLEDKERISDNFANYLYSNTEALEDIISYFSDDYSNYIEKKLTRYYISDSVSGIDFKSASKIFFSNDFSYQYSEIADMDYSNNKYQSDYPASKDSIFTLSNPLNFTKNDRQVGTINNYYSFSDFERVASQDPFTFILAFSPDGKALWQAENVPDNLKKEVKRIYLDSLSSDSIIHFENNYFYFLTTKAKNNTTFITLAPVPGYSIFFYPKPMLVVFLFLTTITLFVVLLMRLFKSYTVQIDSIVEGITASEINLLERHIPIEGKQSELKTVSQTFNTLIDDIDNHIKNNFILELKQKDAELKSLQSQINPHFLYNTLEFIRMSALKDGNEDLSEMIYLLGQLFRNSIKQQKKTTLYEEVENSKLYMQLFQTRYPNKIAYQFFVEPDIEKLILPKFIIQPLIENYVLHGINYKKIDNVIQLKAQKIGNQLIIKIKDNGKGIEQEQLNKMTRYLIGQEDEITSVGFKNVNERLRIFFGENYRMELTSEPNIETVVKIIIQLEEE